MFPSNKLFGKLFSDYRITPLRLANFAEDCLARFKMFALEGQFATVIASLTVALDNMRTELGDVDQSINAQKAKTEIVNNFITEFKMTMKLVEGIVAYRDGGQPSELYRELYPNGLTEYSKVSKTKMPTLMTRMSGVVTKYELQLDEDVTEKLSELKTKWSTLRLAQENKMIKVDDDRAERSTARRQLDAVLTNAVHAVAMQFPDDEEKCSKFFKFQLLMGAKHHNEEGEEVETSQEEEVPEETPETNPPA